METELNLKPRGRSANPFRPGAGHPPPYLAGRSVEQDRFAELLAQDIILENLVLTGLRGVGKTVLLDTLRPLAAKAGWLWTSTDVSESATVSEEALATRLITDLSLLTSHITLPGRERRRIGFQAGSERINLALDHAMLRHLYDESPGLVADKLKILLEFVWAKLADTKVRGLVIAYDEAQNLSDRAESHQYPLSLLLDVFQSLQKKGLPVMLVLTGLPTLYPKLVAARTFAERMFHVITLGRLSDKDSHDAILKPLKQHGWKLPADVTEEIIRHAGGYPYFLQFFGREVCDAWLRQIAMGHKPPKIHFPSIIHKLDNDFFAGRWSRATDRQRELLRVIAELPGCDDEFIAAEVLAQSRKKGRKPISGSQLTQMLAKLADAGLVYRNGHGRYSFSVPLMGQFIARQHEKRVV
ncbi:MAG: ATP-binding protein [Verrucomicrobiaceae bacterium]|nr:ATP-binding protein [Verrucomicrobiaceae bacterium]